jgi:anti-sigma28 factor (negative regulator of flagellin synthesis)
MNTNGIPSASQFIPLLPGGARADAMSREPVDSPKSTPLSDSDRVDLSAEVRPAAHDDMAAAEARIQELRRQIAAGSYLTPEKLTVTADRLHAELLSRRT